MRLSTIPIVGSFSVAMTTAPAAAQYHGYGHHDGWGDGWFGVGHMIFGPILWIVTIGLLVVTAVVLVRWLTGGTKGGSETSRSALDILSDRYARGEIDTAEYEERKRALGG